MQPVHDQLDAAIDQWVQTNAQRIVELTQTLVRVPSESHPPHGQEQAAQEALLAFCQRNGIEAELYDMASVPGLDSHPLRYAGVDCRGRPNVSAYRPGTDPHAARSLILSGHMDVVPAGAREDWTRDPFAGQIEGRRLYGRGAYDMKAGIAANFAVLLMLNELGIQLQGDLQVESVADEEFAGGHGTIAARLKSRPADAVLLPEPSNLSVYRAHRGLRIVRVMISGTGGVTFAGDRPEPAVHRLPELINGIIEFAQERNRKLHVPESYKHDPEPANWMITKVHANDWADDARLAVPESAGLELFWESLPGETQASCEAEFEDWLEAFRTRTGMPVTHNYWLRWIEPYQLPSDHPLTRTVETHTGEVLRADVTALGAPFPCDLSLFSTFGVSAGIILGPAGGNAHAADEWVDLDSLLQVVRIYGRIVCDWCSQSRPQ